MLRYEGGEQYLRVFFNNPFELEPFIPTLIAEYNKTYKNVQRDLKERYLNEEKIEAYAQFSTKIPMSDIPALLESAKQRIEDERLRKEEIDRLTAEKELARVIKKQQREQRELEKKIKAEEPKPPRTRAIYRLDDNGCILEEYESIAKAVEKTGINSKSIRDAANGKQKHAGDYCWRFKDTHDE